MPWVRNEVDKTKDRHYIEIKDDKPGREGGTEMKRSLLTGFVVFLLGVPMLALGATYQIDPDHSSFQFKVRHMTVSNVTGEFKKVKGIASIDENDLTGLKVEVTLDAASVNTDHAKRDDHLKGGDFLDVARYPTITFVSKKVVKVGENRLKVVGDLTLHGVTREVTVDVDGLTPEVRIPVGTSDGVRPER